MAEQSEDVGSDSYAGRLKDPWYMTKCLCLSCCATVGAIYFAMTIVFFATPFLPCIEVQRSAHEVPGGCGDYCAQLENQACHYKKVQIGDGDQTELVAPHWRKLAKIPCLPCWYLCGDVEHSGSVGKSVIPQFAGPVAGIEALLFGICGGICCCLNKRRPGDLRCQEIPEFLGRTLDGDDGEEEGAATGKKPKKSATVPADGTPSVGEEPNVDPQIPGEEIVPPAPEEANAIQPSIADKDVEIDAARENDRSFQESLAKVLCGFAAIGVIVIVISLIVMHDSGDAEKTETSESEKAVSESEKETTDKDEEASDTDKVGDDEEEDELSMEEEAVELISKESQKKKRSPKK